jgi:hypothetical protein
MKQIFLISGKAQHGKDSTAKILQQKVHGTSLIIHNADFLKYIASNYMGWKGGKSEPERTLLQWLGTEKVRIGMQKPLFWVETSCNIIKILEDKYDYFMIPDTRFKNEIFYPQAIFPDMVTTLRVNRLNFDNGLTEAQKNHISETELDYFNFDWVLSSESGLHNLEVEIDKFLDTCL